MQPQISTPPQSTNINNNLQGNVPQALVKFNNNSNNKMYSKFQLKEMQIFYKFKIIMCNNKSMQNSESTTSSSSSSISQIKNNSSTPIISNESPVLDDEQQCLKLIYSISGQSKHSSHITTVSTTSANLFNFGIDTIFEHENDDYYFFGVANGVSGNTKKGFDARLFPLALL